MVKINIIKNKRSPEFLGWPATVIAKDTNGLSNAIFLGWAATIISKEFRLVAYDSLGFKYYRVYDEERKNSYLLGRVPL